MTRVLADQVRNTNVVAARSSCIDFPSNRRCATSSAKCRPCRLSKSRTALSHCMIRDFSVTSALTPSKRRSDLAIYQGGFMTDDAYRRMNEIKAAARAADLAPVISDIRAGGAHALRSIAAEVNERGFS